MKKIWFINSSAMPPNLEPRLQTIKMAHYLGLAGYNVTIISSSVLHNMNKNLINDRSLYLEKWYDDLHFIHIRSCPYKKNNIYRVLNWITFRINLLRVAKKFEKPDIVIQCPGVLLGFLTQNYFRKRGVKYIADILDLQPESLVALGMFKRNNPIIKILYVYEKHFYKKSDELVFSMEGAKDYIIDHKWDKDNGGPIDLKKVHYINNGVDLKDFDTFKKLYKIEDIDLNNPQTKKIIYIGSIRFANDIMQLIKAAEILKNREDIVFLIYGDGCDRETIENYCKSVHLSNVKLKDKWVEPKYVPYIVSQATVNILNYKPGGFGHYGGSQSKMFQYMASGKPICCNIYMSYNLIEKYNIGISQEFVNSQKYAAAIEKLVDLNSYEYNAMCKRARNAASNFDYEYLTSRLIQIL